MLGRFSSLQMFRVYSPLYDVTRAYHAKGEVSLKTKSIKFFCTFESL